jgi:uncharacterized protein (DUF3084 family)
MGAALAVLLLLALCGFIAYIGDLLGRRLGKKRLTVFGLRPKHTAILLTIVTGVLIAGVSFGAAMAIVPEFRAAVIYGEGLAQRNQRLAERNRSLDQQILTRAAANTELEARNQELASANQRLRTESGALLTQNRALTATNVKLDRSNRELQTQSAALKQQNERLASTNGALEKQNKEFARINGELSDKNKELAGSRDRLSKQVDSLRQLTTSLQRDRYIFTKGQRIGHRVIPPNPPLAVLRDTVKALIYDVQSEAERRRARPGIGIATAAYLVPPDEYHGSTSSTGIQEWVVRQAAAIRGRPLVVSATATTNCVEGQPVGITLQCYANEQVFRRGEVIAMRPVDGDASEGLILGDLIQFLRSNVRDRASRANMDMSADDLGEMSLDQLLEAMRRIRRLGGPVAVYAIARTDAPRSGPLNVDLEFRSIGESRVGAG